MSPEGLLEVSRTDFLVFFQFASMTSSCFWVEFWQWRSQSRLHPSWVNDRHPSCWLPASSTAPATPPLPCCAPFWSALSIGWVVGGLNAARLCACGVLSGQANSGGCSYSTATSAPVTPPPDPPQGTPLGSGPMEANGVYCRFGVSPYQPPSGPRRFCCKLSSTGP